MQRVRPPDYRTKQNAYAERRRALPEVREAARLKRTTPEQRLRMRIRTLRQEYGISPTGYLALFHFQNGKCAICKLVLKAVAGDKQIKTRAWVDHDHTTGKARGILCPRCNNHAGNCVEHADYLRKVISYIEAK